MNILYLTNHLNIGGITSYLLSLSKGLKARGHNVYVASSGGELVNAFKDAGIEHIFIPIKTKSEISPKVLISLFKLSKIIKAKNIDIIHANTRVTQVLGCLLHRLSRAPFISSCHGFFKRRFSRRLFGCWGQATIAISQPVKEHLINDFNVGEDSIFVVHNGIDVTKFRARSPEPRAQSKERLGLGDGPVVGIIARLSDVKGHVYLIEAMKKVLGELPQAQLFIVGDGREKENLVNKCRLLGIQNNVFFVPSVRDTKDMLSIMDLFVMPSLNEGLGLSLMEAMASGVAVIASEVGGIKSLIQDGANGLLVRPKDVARLSEAILELLKDEPKRTALGRNARDFICQNFSLEKMALGTEEVYSRCVSIKS